MFNNLDIVYQTYHQIHWIGLCVDIRLQLAVIDEMSLIGVKMFIVIDNRLKSIKHIQNNKLLLLMLSW